MEAFPLLALHPTLREKIISKADWKSYFHLLQTCKTINKATPHKSRNIYVSESFGVSYDDDSDAWEIDYLALRNRTVKYPVDPSVLYGCRLYSLDVNTSTGEDFESLCDALKPYKIKCATVLIEDSVWTGEEWATLLDILKPSKALYYNTEPTGNYFDALLNFKQLRSADLCLDLDSASAVNAALKFLSTCHEVEIRMQDSSNPYFLIQYVLNKIRSEYWPNLDKFVFRVAQHGFEHEDLLEDPNLKQSTNCCPEDAFTATVILPQHFPPRASCKVIIETDEFLHIEYFRGANYD